MLRDYLREHGRSIYALSKESGVAYSTLNDLVNGKVDIDHCKVSLLLGFIVYAQYFTGRSRRYLQLRGYRYANTARHRHRDFCQE